MKHPPTLPGNDTLADRIRETRAALIREEIWFVHSLRVQAQRASTDKATAQSVPERTPAASQGLLGTATTGVFSGELLWSLLPERWQRSVRPATLSALLVLGMALVQQRARHPAVRPTPRRD